MRSATLQTTLTSGSACVRASSVADFSHAAAGPEARGAAMSKAVTKIPLSEAKAIASQLEEAFLEVGLVSKVCGSVRRHKPSVGDIDFIIRPQEGMENLPRGTVLQRVRQVFDSVICGGDKTIIGYYKGRKANTFTIPELSWGAGMLFATGSAEFNYTIRLLAKRLGYKLNRYGITNLKKDAGKITTLGFSEKELFKYLGADYVEPRDRSDKGMRTFETAAAWAGQLIPAI